ncbi:hypothetical protein POM88_003244 [Heracleum sosnowskyi]|uniref:Uncharacterized protein n=1 Tax=Heracleum sosnowskyi TaxID=360622 RepID=A0AAD8NBE0_9APIA|nr:hypothetical protein POM88_003244 [Heracleum sosnowskyi]
MGRNESYNQIYLHKNTTCITPITFLPFLCRLSTKDAVKISEPPACPKKNDPSSPKVGCMGQIKRHNNNKINSTTTPTSGKLKYTQLKKMFSGRNLLTTNTTNISTHCRGNNNKTIDKGGHKRPKFHSHGHGNCAVVVPLNLAELDPPLPVVKSQSGRDKGVEKGSLWKRRGGVAPIQPIQLPYNNTTLLPPSSVS